MVLIIQEFVAVKTFLHFSGKNLYKKEGISLRDSSK